MTTEIAVINRLGVALAADSAVTISGFGQQKVFDSGDKLFELCQDHSVAIMVNGNLDFLGVPWELIIKDFRRAPLEDVPTSIAEWSKAFLSFALAHRAVNEAEVSKFLARFISSKIQAFQNRIVERLREQLNSGTVNNEVVDNMLLDQLSLWESSLEGIDQLDSLADIDPENCVSEISPIVAAVIKERFAESGPSEEARPRLERVISRELLTDISQETRTGLVVCGFGGDDLFPSLHAVLIDGVIMKKLRFTETHHVEITRDVNGDTDTTKELGTAISFAQTDVINRLLRGVDDRLVGGSIEFIENVVGPALVNVFDSLSWKITASDGSDIAATDLAAFLSQKVPDLYVAATERIGDEIEREFKQTISLMPKQELIELAEALVSITAVERKATRDAGTVGGPIDVALITRAEGFVWIKRKHHFSAELNPRYMSRVYGSGTVGDSK